MKFISTAIILLVSPFYLDATADIPDPPVIKSISCNKKDAVINWEPRGDNGAPIRRYVIQYNTSFVPIIRQTVYDSGDAQSSNLTYIASLPPGVNQSFRVIAWNDIGRSIPSSPSEICVGNPDVPYKNPDDVRGEGSQPDNLVIHWSPMPQIEHHGPGFHYRVHWRREEEETFNTRDVIDWWQSSIVIENQPSYQPYRIKVEAVNEVGVANIAPVQVTGYSGEDKPLLAPTNFTLVQIVSPTTALVSWDSVPSDSIRGRFRGYKIITWLKISHRHEIQVSPTTQKALLINLVPFQKNYVGIYVFNDKYNGPPSETISFFMPEGAPSQIPAIDVHPLGPSALYLNWKKPEYPNGVITGYNIYYAPPNGTYVDEYFLRTPPINDPNQLHAKLPGLMSNTVYRVSVTAVNAAGESSKNFIETATRDIQPSVPSVPNFAWEHLAVGGDTATLKITWLPNLDGNPGSDFFVRYKKENESITVETKREMWEDYIIVTELEFDQVYEFSVIAVDGKYQTASAVEEVYVNNVSKMRE